MVKYYSAAGKRLAMRTGSGGGTTGLLWLAGDHLGSTSVAANPDGSLVTNSRQLYKPWGETRAGAAPTPYQYTGQRNETAIGLYFYNARWYDYTIGRFVQADTITTGGVQGWDRYAYVLNNSLKYNDPTGHVCSDPEDPTPTCETRGNSAPLYSRNRAQPMFIAPFRGKFGRLSGARYYNSKLPDGSTHVGEDWVPYEGGDSTIQASGYGTVVVSDPCSVTDSNGAINCEGLEGNYSIENNRGYGNVVIVEYSYDYLPDRVRYKIYTYTYIDSSGNLIEATLTLQPGMSIYIVYAHLANAPTFTAGEHVHAGDTIGVMGNTGDSSAAHLHIEVRVGPSGSLGVDGDITYDANRVAFRSFVALNPNGKKQNHISDTVTLFPWGASVTTRKKQ